MDAGIDLLAGRRIAESVDGLKCSGMRIRKVTSTSAFQSRPSRLVIYEPLGAGAWITTLVYPGVLRLAFFAQRSREPLLIIL